ncbi:PaaI family thioesterase [Hoeflea sp. TYP-13]|uniref:PaaI family thioesterase n=1 Tax=Hoeflea sp. TYP-13 TaxID=3230023 RepID=UPI0034C658F2
MGEIIDLDALNAAGTQFGKLLGQRVVAASPDRIEAELAVTKELCTIPDVLHGGAIMAFADNLGAIATVLNMPHGARTSTIESKTNFLRAVPVGTTAKAVCTPVHKGRQTMVWRTDVFNADGKLAATVTQTQIILPANQ